MPESNKGARARQLKANRAAGVGDETGRLPPRIKAEAIMLTCSICKVELKATKTNTELKQHSMGKHGKADVEECFPGAEMAAKGIMERLAGKGGGGKGAGGGGISNCLRRILLVPDAELGDEVLLPPVVLGQQLVQQPDLLGLVPFQQALDDVAVEAVRVGDDEHQHLP